MVANSRTLTASLPLLSDARRMADVDPHCVTADAVASSSGSLRSPFYHFVPKGVDENLRFRKAIIEIGSSSPKYAHDLWIMCSRDLLFWVNTFCFTYDPDPKRNKTHASQLVVAYPVLPFVTWKYQDEAMLELDSAMGDHDLAIKKSRDMGASWMCLTVMAWRFQFRDMQSFMCISRTEDMVDDMDDPDSLFWKIMFLLEGDASIGGGQPGWMLPKIHRKFLHIGNLDNGATIDGASTTSDAGRGGRRTATLLDEFASVPDGYGMLAATRDATSCRIINSSVKGSGNAFYDMCHSDGIKCLSLHWPLHPEKSAGLYFDANSKPRSAWYDLQCERAAHPMEIASELDMDFQGSDFQFFDAEVIRSCQARDVRDPYWRGEMLYDPMSGDPTGLSASENGRLLLWMNPDQSGEVPAGQYVFGIDVATGSGASNSVISIGNRKTNEKVGEFVTPKTNPSDLATYAYAMGKWFGGVEMGGEARIIWENNGPGTTFRDSLMRLGYKNLYIRRNEDTLTKKISDTPGWATTPASKKLLLGEYRRALSSTDFINRSWYALDECKQYIWTKNQELEHSRSATELDPSGARANHADRVIADALLWWELKTVTIKRDAVETRPVNSMWGRMQEAEREETNARKRRGRWLQSTR